MTPNETAVAFKHNLKTEYYYDSYEQVYLAYKGLIYNCSKINGIMNQDLFNHYICFLPEIAQKWNPSKASFSTHLTISLRGNIRQDYIARNMFPMRMPRKQKGSKGRFLKYYENIGFSEVKEWSCFTQPDALARLIVEEGLKNLSTADVYQINKVKNIERKTAARYYDLVLGK